MMNPRTPNEAPEDEADVAAGYEEWLNHQLTCPCIECRTAADDYFNNLNEGIVS